MLKSIRTLSGHPDTVYNLDYAPDGGQLASAGRDGSVIVWDLPNGQICKRLELQKMALAVSYGPRGKFLAACDSTGKVYIWETGSLKLHYSFDAGPTESLKFSPDGKLLLTGGLSEAHIWEVAKGRSVRSLQVPGERTLSLDFSSDGKSLAAASSHGVVSFFDAGTWRLDKQLQLGPANMTILYKCVFSPDDEMCAASVQIAKGGAIGTSNTPDHFEVYLWNRKLDERPDPSRSLVGHIGWIGGLAFSSDGNFLVSGAFDETARLWDPYFYSALGLVREHEGAVYGVAFSPKGGEWASCSADGTVKLWPMPAADSSPHVLTRSDVNLDSNYIVQKMRDCERRGRNGVLVVVQDLLDGLLALGSSKKMEDAIGTLFSDPTDPALYRLATALMQTLMVRKEQCVRENDENYARFYHQLAGIIDRTLAATMAAKVESSHQYLQSQLSRKSQKGKEGWLSELKKRLQRGGH